MKKMPIKPLIRLKVEYTGFPTINPQRFGQRFVGKVANPNDFLLFHRKKVSAGKSKSAKDSEKDLNLKNMKPDPLDTIKIEDLIQSFLSESAKGLEILPEHELNNALNQFVEKDEKTAITDFVNKTLTVTRDFLVTEDAEKTLHPDIIQSIVSERTAARKLEQNVKSDDMIVDDVQPIVPKKSYSNCNKNDYKIS